MINAHFFITGTVRIKRKIPKFGDSSSESVSFARGSTYRGDDARSIARSVSCLLSYSGNTHSSQRLINIPPFDRRSSREIDYVAHATSTLLEYAYISFVMVRSERVSLKYVLGKYFDSPRRFPEHFHPREMFSKMYIPRILWEYFVPRNVVPRHHFRITSHCVSICYARVHVYCVYVYIYFFIYIYFWL